MCYSVGNVWCCFLVAASELFSDIVETEQLRFQLQRRAETAPQAV